MSAGYIIENGIRKRIQAEHNPQTSGKGNRRVDGLASSGRKDRTSDGLRTLPQHYRIESQVSHVMSCRAMSGF